ncbi:hypothetical protein LG634_22995 [Streptomyces bambusae]|uniref:hypothetical protein n=1 Tax=Streptomyces bambusae TaxID=1550616 RepID=UPI001CFDACEA|nr:hypothetical protein [Streptomyces bambusae]MCB5167685.1 hypothetical protein [Streptomyces bambusae]
MTTAATPATKDARKLLSTDAFESVTVTVARANPDMLWGTAVRIAEEALKFVAAAATQSNGGLRPSRLVDEGWHALILHTSVYAQLCARLGRFVHHLPETPATKRHDPMKVDCTLAAIRAAGYEPNAYLWTLEAQKDIVVSADCMHTECTEGGSNCAAPA